MWSIYEIIHMCTAAVDESEEWSFQASSFQLLKLENLLRWSFFTFLLKAEIADILSIEFFLNSFWDMKGFFFVEIFPAQTKTPEQVPGYFKNISLIKSCTYFHNVAQNHSSILVFDQAPSADMFASRFHSVKDTLSCIQNCTRNQVCCYSCR